MAAFQLYPMGAVSPSLLELEREDCRYSPAFDPIIDTQTIGSCGEREYIASVVRLYGTRFASRRHRRHRRRRHRTLRARLQNSSWLL